MGLALNTDGSGATSRAVLFKGNFKLTVRVAIFNS